MLQQPHRSRVCIFIDALDEYGDDAEVADLITTLSHIASTDCRLCVSSRPSPEFNHEFSTCPVLHVDAKSTNDILDYARFRMRDMISGEGLRHTDLVAEVGLRANGLFLRVKLVTDDLLHGWKRHESPDRLRSRLNSLPQNLTSLYSRILENMELDDRNEVLLSLVPTLCAAKKLTPSEISYAMLSPAEKGAVEEPALFQRLPIISGGLLEMKFDFLSQCEVVVPCHETVIAFVINPRNGCFESLSRAMMLGHECLLNACIQRIVGQDASIQRSEWLTQAYDSETRTEKLTYWKCAIEWWIYYTKWLEIESGSSQAHRLRPLCGEPFQIWVLANGKMVYNYTYCKESVNSYHACSHPSPGLDTLLWLLIERKLSLTAVGLLGLQHRENQLLMPLGGPEQLLETMKMLDLRSKTTHREYDLIRSKATSWHPLLVAAARSQDKSLVIFLVSYAVDLSISPQDIIAAFESTIRGDRGMCQSILENIPKTMRSFELFRSMFKRILDNVLYSRTCP